MKNRAQAFAEFVLLSIPFLILLMGVLQFAHIAVVKIIVNHTAFTTARVAAVDPTNAQLLMVAQEAFPFKDKHNISVKCVPINNDEDIDITVTYKMPLIFPFANYAIKEAKNLSDYTLPIISEFYLPKETIVT